MTPADRAPEPGETDLAATIERLQAELEAARVAATGTQRSLERELDRTLARSRRLERELADTKAALKRSRGRRVVRTTDAVARVVRSPFTIARDGAGQARRLARRVARRLGLRRVLPMVRSGGRATDTTARILAALPAAPAASGSVSALVEARTNPAELRRSLTALLETGWPDLEVLVVGPAADRQLRAATGGHEWSATGSQRIRPVGGYTFAEARREALALATGDHVLLIHDDVRPLEPSWLARLVGSLATTGAGAVGARLLLPAEAEGANGRARIAHLGLAFAIEDGLPSPRPIGLGGDPLDPATVAVAERPAATEACLLVDRATLDEVGLPREDLDDGEPVELCLAIRAAGRSIFVDGGAVLWHRNAVAEVMADEGKPSVAQASYLDRWAPRLIRSVLLDRLHGAGRWSTDPLHVGITLSKDDEAAGFGDWYTAHELGAAIQTLGWRVTYLERHENRWYEGYGACDVVISLLPMLDLFRVPRHVISVAWIRNWTEEWTSRPWFANYDVVLVSSGGSKEIVEASTPKRAHLFPIATNPERFSPRPAVEELRSDVAFVGSHWGADRAVADALPRLAASRDVVVYGRGWDDVAGMGGLSRGLIAYDRIPDVYASTSVAVDDAAISTKPYGSVNSRVFDALAAGAIVVTNNELGARELFDADFPVWTDETDLADQVDGLLRDPARRGELAARYRALVLERHTYARRAVELRDILDGWVRSVQVGLHIGPQTWEAGQTWGDVPYGRDVQRSFERRGYAASLLVYEEAGTAAALRADVALHIFGVRAPVTTRGQVNALWVISHPDRVTDSLCDPYDVVFSASDPLVERLRTRIATPLVSLHQATEPTRFYPDPTGPHHTLLFIGNSRRVPRPIIEALRGAEFDLAVYGGDWTPDLLDPRFLRGEWVPNDEVRRYYSSADIVLNDHWGDMRDLGIISNRVYDALACGAFVVSDGVPGLDEEFDGAVATFTTRDDLHEIIRRSLADPEARRAAAARGRTAVLARHTFAQRIDRIIEEVGPRLAGRPMTVEGGATGAATGAATAGAAGTAEPAGATKPPAAATAA